MGQLSCPFRDWPLGNLYFGYPELYCLPNGRLLASTWSGRCLEIDPDSGSASVQPRIGASLVTGTLQSPAAIGGNQILCTVATRLIWTEVWQLGAAATTRIAAEAAVNAAAFSPDGDLLALGLGMYPLGPPDHTRAAIDLYSAHDLSQPLRQTILPGVAVDRIVFHQERDLLIAITGASSQNRGHIVVLDPETLACTDMAETDFVFARSFEIDAASDHLILAHKRGVEVRALDTLWKIDHQWRGEDLYAAVYDGERRLIYLSSGEVLDRRCERVCDLPVLEKCTGLALLDDGRLVGISQTGILRVWETGSEWEPS